MSAFTGVNGTVCTAGEFAASLKTSENPNPTITCLTHGQSIGVALTAESGFVSLFAVLCLFVLIARKVYFYQKHFPRGDWRLFQGPTDIYMFCLLIFDFIQAIGFTFDTQWAHEGKVFTGSVCTAQGVIRQLGETGVALTTLVITVQSFITVFWRVGIQSRRIALGVMGAIWLFLILWAAIGASIHKNYEIPTPYWCWIGGEYLGERIAGEYFWLWLTLFASIVMYVPLAMWSQGWLSVDKARWWKFRVHRRGEREVFDGHKWRAIAMLAYPVAYCILILPLSVARWMLFDGLPVQSVGTFISIVLFGFSGAVNVLLLLYTRPSLLLLGRPSLESELPSLNTSIRDLREEPMAKVRTEPTAAELGDAGWRPPSEPNDAELRASDTRHHSEWLTEDS